MSSGSFKDDFLTHLFVTSSHTIIFDLVWEDVTVGRTTALNAELLKHLVGVVQADEVSTGISIFEDFFSRLIWDDYARPVQVAHQSPKWVKCAVVL